MTIARMTRSLRGRAITGLLAAAAGTALLAAAPAAAVAPAQHLRFRTFNVPGATSTEPFSINDKGVFAGLYTDQAGVHGFIQAGSHLARFNYPGSSDTTASSINNQGEVVGWYRGSHGPYRGFVRSPGGHFASFTDPLGGTRRNQGTFASGVNDHGAIVGYYVTAASIFHGFIYRSGHFTRVNVPKAFYNKPNWGSAIYSVNDSNVMIGVYTPSHKNVLDGYTESAGHFTSFIAPGAGTQPGDDTLPEGISNSGAIAGASLAGDLVYHGWLLSRGHYTALNDPSATTIPINGEASGTLPVGVNRQGVVIGTYFDDLHVEHGFLVRTGISRVPGAPAARYFTPSAPVRKSMQRHGLLQRA
jgi:hypothetical protein